MTEQEFKFAGQIAGLELVMKFLLTAHLMKGAKSSADLARLNETADAFRDHLLNHIEAIGVRSSEGGIDGRISKPVLDEMSGMVSRCFDQPGAQLDHISKLVLDLSAATNGPAN